MTESIIDSGDYEFLEVCRADELLPGDRLRFDIDGLRVVLFRVDDEFYAIEDRCTHDDGPLGEGELEGCCTIVCPRHGAAFDIKNGKALRLPAIKATPAFPVRLIEDSVMLGLPRE